MNIQDIYELKWPFLMKAGGIHCNIGCKSLKKWSCLFCCNWAKLVCIIRPVLKSWLNPKQEVWLYIIHICFTQQFLVLRVCITICPSKSTLQISASTFEEINEPILLYRTVCRTLYSIWPSFGYFSELLIKGFSKKINFWRFS